jgi:hypothetical protein
MPKKGKQQNGPAQPKKLMSKKEKVPSNGTGYAVMKSVKAPVASQFIVDRREPKWTKTATGFRVVGSELIYLVAGSTSFGVVQIPINPGLVGAFPELSSVACSFERYKPNRISFRLVPNKGTSVAGLVALAPQYDAADLVPATELAMAQYKNSKEFPLGSATNISKDWSIQCFPLPKGMEPGTSKWLYTRPGALASNLDQKTYDCMSLLVAAIGTADTTTVARLWIDYDIDFAELQPSSNLGSIGSLTGVAVSSANLFGSTTISQSSLSVIPVTALTNTITFANPGEYLLSLYLIGTVISAVGSSGGTATVTAGLLSAGSNQTTARINFAVRCTASGQTVILTCTATTITTCTAIVTLANYAAATAVTI